MIYHILTDRSFPKLAGRKERLTEWVGNDWFVFVSDSNRTSFKLVIGTRRINFRLKFNSRIMR